MALHNPVSSLILLLCASSLCLRRVLIATLGTVLYTFAMWACECMHPARHRPFIVKLNHDHVHGRDSDMIAHVHACQDNADLQAYAKQLKIRANAKKSVMKSAIISWGAVLTSCLSDCTLSEISHGTSPVQRIIRVMLRTGVLLCRDGVLDKLVYIDQTQHTGPDQRNLERSPPTAHCKRLDSA
jgi:hypothetical protein